MKIADYSSRIQFYTDDAPPLLTSYLDSTDWQSCLELGCGDGALLYALNKKDYFAGKTVCALDFSEARMKRVGSIDTTIDRIVGDACCTPVKPDSFDFLISTQVIEHVPDDGEMVREIHRLLVKNGIAYVATVFKKWYGWYFYRCNGKWTLDPTHLREYTHDDQLVKMFTGHGFQILENKKTADGRPVMDALLRRVRAGRNVYDIPILKQLRKFEIPIPGYYIWELVCRKN